ncbi:AhpC/TSA family protein [Lacinutrix sp. C3R15]|uniref:TlpA disulfide reductase family protein n=1 Tax=Flavobacteriaceae TaxID=49546 RepID=UPI001C0A38CE|nr:MULTISPECIES: TlpA disulfide reductase family protein [Flavobacteriaceae]MBU2940466.1 AhpC/TSA family protein [Lacinutrix sp. C3R15]MDO6623786.1 TlpA disulfide reductase family protein [Oceanihabitans sp. 1_MG-2023]
MQRIISVLCISLFLISCSKEKNEGYVIHGKLDNPQDNSLVQLLKADGRKKVLLDTARVTNNTFTLNGKVESSDMVFLTINGVKSSLPFIIDNEKINLNIYTDSIFASDIQGGKQNDYFNEYQDFVQTLRNKNKKLSEEFNIAKRNQDTAKINELRKTYEGILKENDENDIAFMTKNKDATLSALILERALMGNKIEFAKGKELYANFDQTIKDTRAGKAIATFIKANEKTAVGSIVPDFSAPNPEGETISLNEIKGKVTIIDFWAAWCGPCRKENPNVVKVYEKYHEKGLEIIGVSLDGTPQQKDAKQAWLDAIEKDNLTWHHVSNLKYFNDPIAKEFNINAIPATFIIDAEGKIIAKNLRGPALEEKIAALLN